MSDFNRAVARFCRTMVEVVEGNNLALASGTVREMRTSLAAVEAAAGPDEAAKPSAGKATGKAVGAKPDAAKSNPSDKA